MKSDQEVRMVDFNIFSNALFHSDWSWLEIFGGGFSCDLQFHPTVVLEMERLFWGLGNGK